MVSREEAVILLENGWEFYLHLFVLVVLPIFTPYVLPSMLYGLVWVLSMLTGSENQSTFLQYEGCFYTCTKNVQNYKS